MNYQIELITDHPIAYESPDHIAPWGTAKDNKANEKFIDEVCEYFGRQINFLDLGCAGGQLTIEMLKKGNVAVGLEGSDYSVKHKRANWPEYHNKNLFTCDITKPFDIRHDGEDLRFDLITAWEVLEHIHPDDLPLLLQNVHKHLTDDGIFVCSVCWASDKPTGIELHQTRELAPWWIDLFHSQNFVSVGKEIHVNGQRCNYLFEHRNRGNIGRKQFWMTWNKK